ncbi:MAG TPA: patatin-like phospholipase family protein [Coleofasciculaceae cyanobacterium]|jgi:predicted acylesterase/phospholipase RssA
MTLLERLTSKEPKRILALDGGGIRGVLTLGFLERIEQILRDRHDKPDLKLCDYFDLIAGTSTGSIIASALAIGMEVSEIKEIYLGIGGKVFGKRKFKKWEALFDIGPLKEELKKVFGDRTLGDSSIKTGLCIMTKRADTGSSWPMLNHPKGTFYPANSHILLREAVRASAAAPVYFVPEKLNVGAGQVGAFVDGGVSMANNPALQVFMVATLKGYAFNWPTGENNLLLVSVGTGTWKRQDNVDDVVDDRVWDWATQIPLMLMEDANWYNQLILQYLSRTKTPWEIDMEIGNLASDLLTPEPALTYLRYDAWLETLALETMGLAQLSPKLESLREMSEAESRHDLAKIGEKAAQVQVKEEHFPDAFNLPL